MNGIASRSVDPGPAIEEPSTWTRLEEIQPQTIVAWGDLDLRRLQERCEALVQRIPRPQRVVLSNTAHVPGLEAPQRFNAALARYMDHLAAASRSLVEPRAAQPAC